MNRRDFLRASIASAVAAATVPAVAAVITEARARSPNPLFHGGLGQYNGIRIIHTPRGANELYSRHLAKVLADAEKVRPIPIRGEPSFVVYIPSDNRQLWLDAMKYPIGSDA